MAQGLFKVGPDAAYTRPALPKKPSAPSAFPLIWVPQDHAITPPKRVKASGDGPLRPEEISSAEAHPTRSVPRSNTTSRDATQQLESDTYLPFSKVVVQYGVKSPSSRT